MNRRDARSTGEIQTGGTPVPLWRGRCPYHVAVATSKDIRRLALQALYQLDARDGDADAVRESVAGSVDELRASFNAGEMDRALDLAQGAYSRRAEADAAVVALAPGWPVARQPAVDRAILRLAHFEMTTGRTPPKVAVNEAVELAKEFSTDRSPAFVNGVLDKILKSLPIAGESDPPPAPVAPEPII